MSSPLPSQKNLSMSVQYVKGIGPRRASALEGRGIRTVADLLHYYPFGYIDLNNILRIGSLRREVESGNYVTVIGTVRSIELVGRPPRQRLSIVLGDETGTIQLLFFARVQYFKKAFTEGESLAVSGKVTLFAGRPQMVHPSIDRVSGDENELQGFLHTRGLVPKYGSSEELKDVNLHVKGLRRIMRTVVDDYVPFVGDHLPAAMLERHSLTTLRTALRSIHFPEDAPSLESARRRLKFDELFAMQLMLALYRASVKVDTPGIPFRTDSSLARKLVDSLPFSLTNAQKRVIREIGEDMKSPRPMNRLMQGDVGSGKTIVALTAMLIAIDNGYQAAIMAPTEILAEQHFRTLSAFLVNLPVSIRLLVGGQKSKLREDVLTDIRNGGAQIIVGTHALIQGEVAFANLGLVVIDEQHRFGVSQRLALRGKGGAVGESRPFPDVLVMTATPIPRTLSMTLYGDLDVSTIDELPSNRKAIRTLLKGRTEAGMVFEFLRGEVRKGRQGYIVYPLVEESEKLDLKAATESFEKLKTSVFPDLRLGLIHGQMPPAAKEETMKAFKAGELDILIGTTVLEVGIDVPNATVMVIEHAERFGLSQLHQLRGRVGRGGDQSTCILIAPDWLVKPARRAAAQPTLDGEEAEKQKAERRLKTMAETLDGFKIAEIDLELRGPGDFFGTRQSGLPELQLANLVTDGAILTIAREEAQEVIGKDPHLRDVSHRPLREFLGERVRGALALVQTG
jgi:ATP-dependent DNA helicase RecG